MPYTEEYIKRLRTQRIIFLIINVVAALSIAILFWAIVHQQGQIRKAAADIQQERYSSILRSCLDQNERHDDAIKTLNKLLTKSGVSKARRKASRRTTIQFINALAPKRDCIKVVADTVGKELPPPSVNRGAHS